MMAKCEDPKLPFRSLARHLDVAVVIHFVAAIHRFGLGAVFTPFRLFIGHPRRNVSIAEWTRSFADNLPDPLDAFGE